MSHYLLLESGSKLLLESSGALQLEQDDILAAFTFFPEFPDRIPPNRYPHSKTWTEEAAVFVPKTIPVADILHDHWFLPHIEDRIPTRKISRELTEATSPALFNPTVLATLGWLPTFPDHPDTRHATPVRQGMTDGTPSFNDVVTAGRLSWLPEFPDHAIARRTLYTSAPLGYATFPPFIAAAVTCWSLGHEALTATGFIQEALTTTDLLGEGLATTGLIAETLC